MKLIKTGLFLSQNKKNFQNQKKNGDKIYHLTYYPCYSLIRVPRSSDKRRSAVEQILYNILKIAPKIQVDIFWIPSQVGINGNDKADEIVKKGTLSTSTIQNKIRYT